MGLTGLDEYIIGVDKALKVLTHEPYILSKERPNRTSITLMRVNYAGEIAAQGLYLGRLAARAVQKT